MKFKKINLKSLFIKLSIFVVSLLLLLTLLELSLRLLGKKWQQGRPDYMSEETIAKHDKIVACFGDSYTVGGLGTKDLSYPGILNKMTASDNTAVLNLGICESNSSQVLEAIENYTATNNPEAIVLLVGAANKYNFYGMKKINFYQKLRIYKMYQIMKLSVENRFLKKQIVKSFSETPNTGYYLSNDIEKIFSDAMQIDKAHGTLHMANYYISRKNDRLPIQSSFVSTGNKKVKELIEDLSAQEKKKILVDIVHIYAFIDDKAKAEQYYRLAKKYNPEQAKEMFVFYCLDNADMNEKEKLKAFNDFIAENPYEGYCNIINYYLNKAVFIKDKAEKERRLKLAKNYLDKIIRLEPENRRTYEIMLSFYRENGEFEKAQELYETKFLEEGITTRFKNFYYRMAYYLIYYGKFGEAVEYFLKAFEQNPRLDLHCYYYFSKAFDLQNKYDAKYVLNKFEEISKKYPDLQNNTSFNTCKESFKNRERFEEDILEWLQADIEKIIDICRKKDIKLIIQNYPFPYHAVNNLLRQTAEKNNIIFIDNYSVFEKIAEEDGYDKYFLDFDHCTPEGHRIIADNVYAALAENKVIRK